MNTDNQENIYETDEPQKDFYDFRYNYLKKKGTVVSIVMIWLFCLVIFGVTGFHIMIQDKSFSESENRVLADAPALTLSSIADGSFMRSFETYLTDQFPFRDKLISLKTLADRTLGKTEENGVYIGSEGFLFESQTPYTKSQAKDIAKAVKSFTKKNSSLEAGFLLLPNSSYIYSQQLPEFLEMPSQRSEISKIHKLIDDDSILWPAAAKILKANAENQLLYYKTDHHWTTRGAYLLFKEIITAWGFEDKKSDIDKKFDFYTVSDTFEGTLASTCGVHDTLDTVEICLPKDSKGSYVVNFESTGDSSASVFFPEKLENKNHYEVFLGGNYDKVVISTVSQRDEALLLIKDSYANCMIPMLTPYFNKIVVIDPRYLTDSLESIIKENDFTHVLFLYNLNTLLEDTSLVPCLGS